MADRRGMRGSRLGAVSYETDRNDNLAPRQIARYRTENGEEFDIPDRKSTRLNSSHITRSRMPSSA